MVPTDAEWYYSKQLMCFRISAFWISIIQRNELGGAQYGAQYGANGCWAILLKTLSIVRNT